MKQFPSGIKFKHAWRAYQQRLLEELEGHLDDDHLHVVAPPGSGKTVLGLEVMLRLNKPTLILAPTVAIRNQWIQRFYESFLQVKQKPEWISSDIKRPRLLTVATYQSLNALFNNACTEEELEKFDKEVMEEAEENSRPGKTVDSEVIGALKDQDVGVLIVDEAHHLKNVWWKSLIEVKKALSPTVVGLTATPPYDVSPIEWQRYIQLNGPVDAEISIPELVAEGGLCPHQDFVMFSFPTINESLEIIDYRERVEGLFAEIKADEKLVEALERHPIYQHPKSHLEWIYGNLEYYSATLIFLNAARRKIADEHLEVIGDRKLAVPALNFEWLETLLVFYLYKDQENFGEYEEHRERLLRKLKRHGLVERQSISFRQIDKINRYLGSSISKLESINKIVDFEYGCLRGGLRMVILADYIRKEFLVNGPENNLDLNKIGVVSIFERLRRAGGREYRLGVLTGSLVIIPALALDGFREIAAKLGVDQVHISPLPFDDQYLLVSHNEQLKHRVVHIVTHIFQEGHIEVLIGTKSLLGEGWDAPSINALILASFVGSYVLSNQMRGRAIRTERRNADKTGNIWHLVCVDSTSPMGGDDVDLLRRRFKAFVGVSLKEIPGIENGVDRLNLSPRLITKEDIRLANNEMLTYAGQRGLLKERWRQALEGGVKLVEEIKVPFPENKDYKRTKSIYLNKTIAYAIFALISTLISLSEQVLDVSLQLTKIANLSEVLRGLSIFGVILLVVFGYKMFKVCGMYIKYRDISKDIHQIGVCLVEALVKVGVVKTNPGELEVVSRVDSYGAVYCHLDGGTTYERSTFIRSLHEIIGPVGDPRYIIIRKSILRFFQKKLSQRDYHSVPEIIGRKKEYAEYFAKQWSHWVGSCELVYTRTIEGRKTLLRSRIHTLASEFQDKTERVSMWR